jgi:hypothetical protein
VGRNSVSRFPNRSDSRVVPWGERLLPPSLTVTSSLFWRFIVLMFKYAIGPDTHHAVVNRMKGA